MEQKTYIVEGRQFRTEVDYNRAVRDRGIIEKLRSRTDFDSRQELEQLCRELEEKKYHFFTLLGEDFLDEVQERLKETEQGGSPGKKKKAGKDKKTAKAQKSGKAPQGSIVQKGGKDLKARGSKGNGSQKGSEPSKNIAPKRPGKIKARAAKRRQSPETVRPGPAADSLDPFVMEELKKRERNRRLTVILCSIVAACCLGYFALYTYYDYKTGRSNAQLSELKEKPPVAQAGNQAPVIHYTDDGKEPPPVLDDFKKLLNINKRVIGWLKIDDTNINYPVMQTGDNEYYLNHNLEQEYDKNGSIFMDKDCDVLKPSTNFILYGHHMKSGKMFGKLDLYSSEEYYKKHPYIQFDTIYEKGTYEVMYAFRSRIYSEEDIVFKYYQFIDALSEREFDSYMEEMAKLSFYDTGVTAQYGDQLLTLSTCDYEVKDGRFVVVARKLSE